MEPKNLHKSIARLIPVVLMAIIGYVTWIVVVQICADYLLRPPPMATQPRRQGAAIAILVIYFLLLLIMAICYIRLLQTVATNPGYVPRSSHWHHQQKLVAEAKGSRSTPLQEKIEKTRQRRDGYSGQSDVEAGSTGLSPYPDIKVPASNLEAFYTKDVFVCRNDGRPIWCTPCLNWKPDRAHHCSEVGRCVRKMDHFCPWVGGIVSETNFKYFLQFVSYALFFCIFIGVFMAVFVAEKKQAHQMPDVHWILALAFAALFGLFSAGMVGSTLQLILINSTTVENLIRKSRSTYLAVYIPRPENLDATTRLRTITYPIEALVQSRQTLPDAQTPEISQASSDPPLHPAPPLRTFAIFEVAPPLNPWDIGMLRNFKEVMGYRVRDWFLPLKHSPCCDHTSKESDYPLGPIIDRLREQGGISTMYRTETEAPQHSPSRSGNKRNRRRSLVSGARAEGLGEEQSTDSEKMRGRNPKKRTRHFGF